MPTLSNPVPPLPPVAACRPKLPDFFIVGAPRCGTTAMAQYLAGHPGLFMARKEMHFFGRDLQFGPQFYRRDRTAYLEEFAPAKAPLIAGEASVWYLYSRQAAAEIKAFNPHARIVIMLREPSEMLYSLYHQFRFDGNEHLPTFRAALGAQAERRAGRQLTRQTYLPQGLVYDEVVAYARQVRRYFDTFGRDAVQVVVYDDFLADPAAACNRVLEFLGLGSMPEHADYPVINANKSVKSSALRALMSDPLVRGTAIALRSWLPRPAFTAMQHLESRLFKANLQPEKRTPLDADLRLALRRQFRAEVEQLSDLLDRDLTHWSRETPPVAQSALLLSA